MNAQPGWYEAGVSGMERWWDGTQWTEHQRPASRPPVQVPPAQQYPAAGVAGSAGALGAPGAAFAAGIPAMAAAPTAPMGWFQVPGTTDVRWWDGTMWTPHRLRDGQPRPDAFAIEPGNLGVVLGIVFIVLSIAQTGTYNLSGQPFFAITPALFLMAGIIWLIAGVRAGQLKKLPAPVGMPIFDATTRPLPGEVEGPGAGWFPVSGQINRWWTGTRWSAYIGQKFGVRPVHSGVRAYRLSMVIGWVLGGIGALAVVLGFMLGALFGRWFGLAISVPGVVLVLVAVLVLLMTYTRRYTMIPPTQAPPLR